MGRISSTDATKPRRHRSFCPIPDNFKSIGEVQAAIRAAGLESSDLIIGVDFTKSNTWTGRETFDGRCLHDLYTGRNPYQHVIEVLGRTLSEFDDDNLIPAYGFGDASTGDRACFPFNPDGSPCQGFDHVLDRYSQIAREVRFAGPTCFAPVIREAIRIVAEQQSYHILVIIADGQVTDQSSTGATAQALAEASKYPLSIITVGVGDGPWHAMESYDDELPARNFDNFQFVEYASTCAPGMRSPTSQCKLDAGFALHALMEIPDQYQLIKDTGLLNVTPVVTDSVFTNPGPPHSLAYSNRPGHSPNYTKHAPIIPPPPYLEAPIWSAPDLPDLESPY